MKKNVSALNKNLNRLLSKNLNRRLAALSFCILVSAGGFALPTLAQADASAPSNADMDKMENKMFSRQYPNDPPEKRVERIELLVFGATQAGDLAERWARVSKAITDRQNPEATMPQPKGGETPTSPGKTAAAAPKGGNYPAVDSLEWRVLKKTYKTEPISDRLSRLETKLLGQANPGMALIDRVERLKKIGASVAAGSQPGNSAVLPPSILGPMPRAYPRNMPFSMGDPDDPSTLTPFSMRPFGGDDLSGLGQINRMMSEMMTQMNRQMRDLKTMPPGVYQYKFDSGDPNSTLTPFKVVPMQPGKPGQSGQSGQPGLRIPVMPRSAPSIQEKLPPYADPNSI